ncbi:MAG TPA: 3'-5' exonuclease [Acidimicrobiales bacterium]|nr:3'-5' exonuclease [Acidimicrobiales bacterium]
MGSTGRLPLYGLDIETDTAAGGLDPGRAAVVAVALSSDGIGQLVLTGAEPALLAALDAHLAELAPGVLVTWNGGAFDLPFLSTRAAAAGVRLGLELAWDGAGHRPGRAPLPGHVGSYAATWHGHRHLDACRAWRRLSEPGEPCGLKAVARSQGLEPVEVDDPGGIHRLPLGDLRRYVASDALLARRLAELRWREVRRFVDRMPRGGQLALAPHAAGA